MTRNIRRSAWAGVVGGVALTACASRPAVRTPEALAERVMDALEAGDAATLEPLTLDVDRFTAACPSTRGDGFDGLLANIARLRPSIARTFSECVTLGVGRMPVARISGGEVGPVYADCPALQDGTDIRIELEAPDAAVEVLIPGPFVVDGAFNLGHALICRVDRSFGAVGELLEYRTTALGLVLLHADDPAGAMGALEAWLGENAERLTSLQERFRRLAEAAKGEPEMDLLGSLLAPYGEATERLLELENRVRAEAPEVFDDPRIQALLARITPL